MEEDDMRKILDVLEIARHSLVTLHGLIAADGEVPEETFQIDEDKTIRLIDRAVNLMENTYGVKSSESFCIDTPPL